MQDGWLQRALLTGLVSGLLFTGGCRSADTSQELAEAEQKLKPPITPTPILETSALRSYRETSGTFRAEPAPAVEPAVQTPVEEPVTAATELAYEPRPSFTEYQVKKGDSLYKLSRRFYGNNVGWKKIYQANEDKIKNPDHLLVGTMLRIPD